MKKFLLTLIAAATALVAAVNVQAAGLIEGEQYTVVDQERSAQPEVTEFFSFYCPHCYSFEMEYKIPQKIQAQLPENASFKQYHVDFLGSQGENLTRAWALAMALGVEDKVRDPLFEAAQRDAFKSMDDIRRVFIDNGVTAEQFDGGINSFAVTALTKKQQNMAAKFNVQGVPDFFVNNRFQVNPQGLSRDDFIGDYVKTVIELLKK